jgi:FAD/FMN-containing dehydrogenase
LQDRLQIYPLSLARPIAMADETQRMQTIKTALDPMSLMNPDKVLPY